MTMIRFKNYKRKPVIVHCKGTDRVCTFQASEERSLHESWEDAALSHGLVPMDEVERTRRSEEVEAASIEAEVPAEAEAEAKADAERAAKLKAEQEKAEIAARRSEAAKKGQATRRAKAAAK